MLRNSNIYSKTDKHESSMANIAGRWKNNFISVKIISKPTFIYELNSLEAFHIYKPTNDIVNCEFTIPSLSDYSKYCIKSFFIVSYLKSQNGTIIKSLICLSAISILLVKYLTWKIKIIRESDSHIYNRLLNIHKYT